MPDVRLAVSGDAAAIATIHVDAWNTAYAALLPREVLANQSLARRTAYWTETLARPRASASTWVVTDDRAVRGFVDVGPATDADAPPGSGEVHALYVAPRESGRGLGGRLLEAGCRALEGRGHASAVLWVLAENHGARRFYERHGWRRSGEEAGTKLWNSAPTIRYARRLLA